MITPLEIISWTALLLMFLLALRLPGDRYVFLLTGIATVIIIMGFILSEKEHQLTYHILLRISALSLVWIATYLVLRYKRMVSEIKNQKQRLDAIFQNAQEGMIVTDSSGSIIMMNSHVEALFGYTTHELVGQKIEKLVPEGERERHVELRNGFMQSPMGKLTELYGYTKSGAEIPVEINLGHFHDNGEAFSIAFISDVTPQKKVEHHLQNEKRLSQMYFDIAPTIVLILDTSGNIENVNKFGCNALGYERSELIGKNAFDFAIPPDELAKVKNLFEKMIGGENVETYENHILTKDKKNILVKWKNQIIKDEKGVITGTLSAGEDITEMRKQELQIAESRQKIEKLNIGLEKLVNDRTIALKEALLELQIANKNLLHHIDQHKVAEEKLAKNQKLYSIMAHNFPNGIIGILNRDLKYIFVDGSELKRLGFDKQSMIGGKIFDGLFFDATTDVENHLAEAFKGRNIGFESTIGGNQYYINAVPLEDTQNNINEILVVISNISAAKKIEDDLRHNLERERELNELKSSFVTMASHEFRTPLSTILSSLFLLEKYNGIELDEKKIKHINRIKNTVGHLTNILNDFLSLGKLDEGRVDLSSNEIVVTDYVNEILKEIYGVKKVGQRISYSHTGHPKAKADKMLLKNIIINLVYNSIKYSPDVSEIEISSETNANHFKLKVKDNGVGIPNEAQPHIFERFYRAKNITGIQGTGLGLHLVKKYCELMKGSIKFNSTEGVGSTFEVQFPMDGV